MRIVVAATAAFIGLPAQASIISGSFNFTASVFTAGAPVDQVMGAVTFSFDNAASFADVAAGITVTGPNVVGTLAPGMKYLGHGADELMIGDLLNGAGDVLNHTNDWLLVITDVSTHPAFGGFVYATTTTNIFVTFTGSLTRVTSVPEPATLGLLAIAALALFGATRARRSVTVPGLFPDRLNFLWSAQRRNRYKYSQSQPRLR
jgi:hypothetical protein